MSFISILKRWMTALWMFSVVCGSLFMPISAILLGVNLCLGIEIEQCINRVLTIDATACFIHLGSCLPLYVFDINCNYNGLNAKSRECECF